MPKGLDNSKEKGRTQADATERRTSTFDRFPFLGEPHPAIHIERCVRCRDPALPSALLDSSSWSRWPGDQRGPLIHSVAKIVLCAFFAISVRSASHEGAQHQTTKVGAPCLLIKKVERAIPSQILRAYNFYDLWRREESSHLSDELLLQRDEEKVGRAGRRGGVGDERRRKVERKEDLLPESLRCMGEEWRTCSR